MKVMSYVVCGFFLSLLAVLVGPVMASDTFQVVRPSINFLLRPDVVLVSGYSSNLDLLSASRRNERTNYVVIQQSRPFFGWQLNAGHSRKVIRQHAYQLKVFQTPKDAELGLSPVWDSGKVYSSDSINVPYSGQQLAGDAVYFWRVTVWTEDGESSQSRVQGFRMGADPAEYGTARHLVQKHDVLPRSVRSISQDRLMIDFGKAAFGRLRLSLHGGTEPYVIQVHLGEQIEGDSVNRNPPGSIRYRREALTVQPGFHTYIIAVTPDDLNTRTRDGAVLMPDYIGEVTPFRYVEIEGYRESKKDLSVVQEAVYSPFDEERSAFESSDPVLNSVWELSRYSIKATTFAGIYVDGDRERIPYEADALISQLGHYAVDQEYALARYTHEYLMKHPTWPTEWIMQSVILAWNDYLYTGNSDSLRQHYDALKSKTLVALADETGLISTRTEKLNEEVMRSISVKVKIGDLVDWPQAGVITKDGETDGFVFSTYNVVINAYHYRVIDLMRRIAEVVGRTEDAIFFESRAKQFREIFRNSFFDKEKRLYRDGVSVEHYSLHGNMFPLAFGLVDEKDVAAVLGFVQSRGMACSPYGAQFLLEALYEHHAADHALALLTSKSQRSWYNMLRSGSTITTEAWDIAFKPNMDWNHAWGAAPANIIPHRLMGISPLTPGFGKILIKPQPGSLKWAKIRYPSIRGDIEVYFEKKWGNKLLLNVTIPANSEAILKIPVSKNEREVRVSVNKVERSGLMEGGFVVIDNVPPGSHEIVVD